MKQFKEIVIGIFVILIFGWLIKFVYTQETSKRNKELTKRIAELSSHGGPPETIEGLRQAIALYENQIERNVQEGAQTGVYWKILAIRLADRNLDNDALAALERAIYYNSEEPVLYYLTGVSAAKVAKSKVGFSADAEKEKEHYFKLSENSYLQALDLDITYAKPMYGLAVLYTFELNRQNEAIAILERYMQLQRSDFAAMGLLARAYYMTGAYNKAMEMYDMIASSTKNQKLKQEALNNKDFIQQGLRYE